MVDNERENQPSTISLSSQKPKSMIMIREMDNDELVDDDG